VGCLLLYICFTGCYFKMSKPPKKCPICDTPIPVIDEIVRLTDDNSRLRQVLERWHHAGVLGGTPLMNATGTVLAAIQDEQK